MEDFIERVLVSKEEIVDICENIGSKLTEKYADKKPLVIGLLKGSVPFMAELIKHIKCEIEIDFMCASSYKGVHSTGSVVVTKDTSIGIKNRYVILVEDIIDTGLTINEIKNLLKDRGAKSIEVVTLVDKAVARTVKGVEPDYVGKIIPNEFVVGFGLDYDELYRNLEYIGVLKKSVYENRS